MTSLFLWTPHEAGSATMALPTLLPQAPPPHKTQHICFNKVIASMAEYIAPEDCLGSNLERTKLGEII